MDIESEGSIELQGDEEPDIDDEDVFPPSFMQEHTDHDSLWDFFGNSQWEIDGEEDLKAVPDDEFDAYVAANSNFDDWDEMKAKAAAQMLAREMDF
ncbi:hypothetical protein [Halorussus pelagicus]|uniref:hypothetical protein n=1 Tax=Halorussus pelagicus TaxID=2505977 RepID=UPI000FFB0A87|nr:hypothetical protein [Halorussus pelagicus]